MKTASSPETLSSEKLIEEIQKDLSKKINVVLLFAHNGVGKTRLSMDFKDSSLKNHKNNNIDEQILDYKHTLYFNAFTEDLFSWDNDLANNTDITLKINQKSRFFAELPGLALEEKIEKYLEIYYLNFNFKIDYDTWQINFYKDQNDNIKISRGEEHIFIFCMFLAIMQLALDEDDAYKWVKYIYIDDPISSLDENNAISIAHNLAQILTNYIGSSSNKNKIKFIISSHHSLFFNVIKNKLKESISKIYLLTKSSEIEGDCKGYQINRKDSPLFYHLVMLDELDFALKNDQIVKYHFNILRSIMEMTGIFLGYDKIQDLPNSYKDKDLYIKALNVLSHGDYAVYESSIIAPETKKLFKEILNKFLKYYKFQLPSTKRMQQEIKEN